MYLEHQTRPGREGARRRMSRLPRGRGVKGRCFWKRLLLPLLPLPSHRAGRRGSTSERTTLLQLCCALLLLLLPGKVLLEEVPEGPTIDGLGRRVGQQWRGAASLMEVASVPVGRRAILAPPPADPNRGRGIKEEQSSLSPKTRKEETASPVKLQADEAKVLKLPSTNSMRRRTQEEDHHPFLFSDPSPFLPPPSLFF